MPAISDPTRDASSSPHLCGHAIARPTSAGAFLATEVNFRRLGGYRELWVLRAALDEETPEGKEGRVG